MNNQQLKKKNKPFLLIIFLCLTTFLTSKIFEEISMKDITIYGSELFSNEDIVSNSSLNFPTPLIFVKTKYVEQELKKNLTLKNVAVLRQVLPFGLKIIIKTKTPIAYGEKITNGKKIAGFIDEDGFFINQRSAKINSLKKLSSKVIGWREQYSKKLSKILKYQKNNEVEFIAINFSSNGFLTLQEKSLKKILLGFNPKIIETQLQIISDIKTQIKGKDKFEKIDTIDLTDPSNIKIKVFKP